jgi:hypothetical protein
MIVFIEQQNTFRIFDQPVSSCIFDEEAKLFAGCVHRRTQEEGKDMEGQ